jgi:hypothetical protein
VRASAVVLLTLLCTNGSAEELRVAVSPPEVMAGSREGAAITVTGADGLPVAGVRLRATLGEVAPGRWAPADRRSPGLVVVAAEAPDGRLGGAVIELVGRGSLPTATDPGAEVVVAVGGRTYGPVVADAGGKALVEIEVRVGETEAEITATTPTGRQTITKVALPEPTYPRGLAFLPRTRRGGERGVVTAFLPRGHGEPRIVVITASGPVALDPPVFTGSPGAPIRRWEAPFTAVAPGEVRLEVHAGDEVLERGTIEVTAPPRAGDPQLLGVHAGGMTAFDGGASATAGVDWTWRFLRLGADVAFGEATQVSLSGGVRVRVLERRGVAVDAGAGVGAAWVDGEMRSAFSPFVYLGAGVSFRVGRGELGVDLRYADLRVDEFRVGAGDGNLAGLALLVAYRQRL